MAEKRRGKNGERIWGGTVVPFPANEHAEDADRANREHVVPPAGINDSKRDPRPNTPPRDGIPGQGKRWTELHHRVEVLQEITWDDVVAEMDSDELARRQFKAWNGTFTGRPPSRIPQGFVRACDAELVRRGAVDWRSAYRNAISTLVEVATTGEKDSDRVKAAALIIERIEGKVPDKVVVTSAGAGESVDDILAGVLATVEAEQAEEAAVARAHDYASRMNPMEGNE